MISNCPICDAKMISHYNPKTGNEIVVCAPCVLQLRFNSAKQLISLHTSWFEAIYMNQCMGYHTYNFKTKTVGEWIDTDPLDHKTTIAGILAEYRHQQRYVNLL